MDPEVVDPGEMEMNAIPPDDDDERYAPQDDDPVDDEDAYTYPSNITKNETSFTIPRISQESRLIEQYRNDFKSKYEIDDETFDVLRMNLERKGNKIYITNMGPMRRTSYQYLK